jgi:hypothetical protein
MGKLRVLFSAVSGAKQNRVSGRKFESVASKRKRKTELQRKNLELSRSFIKFLKTNDDTSASNKVLVKMKVESRWKTWRESSAESVPKRQF